MKKKRYIKPVVSVMEMETTAILAGSGIQKAADVDYSDENVKDSGIMKLIREFGQTSPRFSFVPPGITSEVWGKIKRGCVISHIPYALFYSN